jgi:hypothetical protein
MGGWWRTAGIVATAAGLGLAGCRSGGDTGAPPSTIPRGAALAGGPGPSTPPTTCPLPTTTVPVAAPPAGLVTPVRAGGGTGGGKTGGNASKGGKSGGSSSGRARSATGSADDDPSPGSSSGGVRRVTPSPNRTTDRPDTTTRRTTPAC